METNTYQIISNLGFICAGIFFVITIVLFFVFDVVHLYGQITGRNAQKRVKELREQSRQRNRRSVEMRYNFSNEEFRVEKEQVDNINTDDEDLQTEPLKRDLKAIENDTTILKYQKEEETVVLNIQEEGTVVLETEGDSTTLLNASNNIQILEDIEEIHTDEII